jgi:hypothetical protein
MNMKNLFTSLAFSTIVVSSLFFGCSKEKTVELDSTNTLKFIKSDININKYYFSETNQYGYSSDKFAQAVHDMPSIFNSRDDRSKTSALKTTTSMTPEAYKAHVLELYGPLGHDSKEVNTLFQTTQSMIDESSNYNKLLDNLSSSGTISNEESEILKDYLTLFSAEGDKESFKQKTTVYIHYVNNSNFPVLEKRGMLTVFDILSDNQEIFLDNKYVFSKAWTANSPKASKLPSTVALKVDMDTACGGRIIIGLVGGAITGNGIGGLVGVGAALFENWVAGCWD